MLRSLSIRDVVLIGRLDLSFPSGLCVLTGETGAGKSILLDALGLALGGRAEARLARRGADRAAVTAEFDLPPGHAVLDILAEQELAAEDALILRRTLGADGRSRAFVNDQPVSVGLLRRLGEELVEIHGQFDNQRLLVPAAHRGPLDAFGGHAPALDAAARAHGDWSAARAAAEEAAERLAAARRDEAFLRHAVEELADLAPEAGEEERLAEQRTLAMHAEQVIESLNAALADLSGDGGAEERLQSALRHLDRARAKAGGHLDGALATLDRAAEALAEGVQDVERLGAALDLDPAQQERVEERLFTLRALARKHDVAPDDLPALAQDLTARLAALDDGGADLARLETAAATAREAFVQAAADLSAARVRAARRLEKAMAKELEPLRLGKAAFHVTLSLLDEDRWTVLGRDGVVFEVSTNPGAAPGPLNRIASGGELSRFMLALKAVLAAADPVPTLVFDEVDSGIGGAVAAAVGTRLDGLARDVQVLVVTHSPQVAARGGHHWRVAKAEAGGTVETTVIPLDPAQRREEIARMLAGAEVTDAARAAADSLLEGPAE